MRMYINENESGKYDHLSEKEQLELIIKDPNNISYISNISVQLQLKIVKMNPWLLRNIVEKIGEENVPEMIKLASVRKDSYVINCLKNPSKQVQLEVVIDNVINILSIKNPDDEVAFYCIISHPELLRRRFKNMKIPHGYFQNLPIRVQEMLIEFDPVFLMLIENLNPSLKSKFSNYYNTFKNY